MNLFSTRCSMQNGLPWFCVFYTTPVFWIVLQTVFFSLLLLLLYLSFSVAVLFGLKCTNTNEFIFKNDDFPQLTAVFFSSTRGTYNQRKLRLTNKIFRWNKASLFIYIFRRRDVTKTNRLISHRMHFLINDYKLHNKKKYSRNFDRDDKDQDSSADVNAYMIMI